MTANASCQHGNGCRTAVQPADDARHQDARPMEHVAPQQIGKVGNAGYHHRGQPDVIRRQADIRGEVLVGEHGEDDAADGKELGERNHLVVLHALRQLGKGMLQLGEQQHHHNHHHREPQGLRDDNRRQAISDERNDNGRDAEHMVLRLLDVIIQRQQHAKDSPASYEKAVTLRFKNVKQVAQDADKGECAVGTEQGGLALPSQADFALRKADKQGKNGNQNKRNQLLRQILVNLSHTGTL